MYKESAKRRAQRKLPRKAWVKKNPEKRNKNRRENYKKGAVNNKNFRSNWTIHEHSLITDPNHPRDRVLAEILGRTVQAIQVERCRQKKGCH